ncbi:MAG: bifunctional [glutamate--ammonia ligase]-adenylyl-L-tyrosine phosphorylase/[glutamate--ammonia-ligase] adenylyltransferase [Myxococcales bacterium]|nr:bifunctional [glutamate--ammonia ligase]-adenylyl-L-tyrosine phosphorylase/[glutamate--ammonia-ligase] adenylyltransferase [Myxococcales bacterium]
MPNTPVTPIASAESIDPEAASSALDRAREQGLALERLSERDVVARAGAAAPAVLPMLLARPELVTRLAHELDLHGRLAPAEVKPDTSLQDKESAQRFLRRARDEALVRTALRELYGHADVDRTAKEWSSVAATCADIATTTARAMVEARQGVPLDASGKRVPFVVLGMGKLAGEELNLGSDIDLCFFYETDEGAAGERTIHEHFARVGSLVTALLDDVTEDGFAFRVDLRLRPEGSSGAIANSLSSAERYYETWGRPWERAALLRSRPCAGDLVFGATLSRALEPFVFRRAVDPTIAMDVAKMLERARREQLEDDARDLKLGRGGIREAEFFVQSLQLVWGGRHAALRVPGTVQAVRRLQSLALITRREGEDFLDAWAVLRRAEHRVQVMNAYATHLLPIEAPRRLALARSLGYESIDRFEHELDRARRTVRELFSSLFAEENGLSARPASTPPPRSPEAQLCDDVARAIDDEPTRERLPAMACEVLGVRDGETAAFALLRLARKADAPLGTIGRERAPELGPRLLAEVGDAPDPDRALSRLADLLERVGSSRSRYAQRLANNPDTTRALVGLLGTSDALARAIVTRPELIDALLTVGVEAPDERAIDAVLEERTKEALASEDDQDDPIERAVGAMRRTMREVELAVGLGDMGQAFSAGEVSRRLSALAEGVARRCFVIAANEAAERFGLRRGSVDPLDGIAVVAMGSLAARELGYGGDIDVIVLYEQRDDGDDETVGGRRAGVSFAEFVARVTQRAIALLSAPHRDGPGYPVDVRLRPSGAQGTLITSLSSFERYHHGAANEPSAHGWERQALIRARAIAGDPALRAKTQQVLSRIAFEGAHPDPAEVRRLRARMESELGRESHGVVSLKYGRGSLVDVEFATQALQMRFGRDHAVRSPTTRVALRAARAAGYVSHEDADALLHAEKILRRALLASRLVHGEATVRAGSTEAHTVARKLGYRAREDRAATEALLADIERARRAARAAFDRVLATLATNPTEAERM